MELLKLAAVFAVVILALWWKKPLALAMVLASAGACLLFRLGPGEIGEALGRGIAGWETVQLLAVFYLITFLQRMLELRDSLAGAQWALDGLFNDRRVNSSVAPALLGLLPAVGTVLLCGDMVRRSTGGYLSTEEQAFVTSYYRHVPELFLPTYTSTLIAVGLTGGRVDIGRFVLAMLPMLLVLMGLGWLFYLRKVPKDAGAVRDRPRRDYWLGLGRSLWPLGLTILLIIALHVPVHLAVLAAIALYVPVGRFRPAELRPMVRSAFEGKIMLSTVLIMVFKEVLAATGVITRLPRFFEGLPIPTFLVFALIFFFGSIVSGSQAVIVLCMAMAMESGGGLALFVLLMSMAYAASQLSPTHICLAVCAEDYGVPLGALIRRTLPVILTFCLAAFGYYGILALLGL